MKIIQVLTDSGLKNVIIDGDEPTPNDMARMREQFQYAPQMPTSDMGGTQTVPMQLAPVPQPEEPEIPELKPEYLEPDQARLAERKGKAFLQTEQAYKEGTGVESNIPDYMKARFTSKGPTTLDIALGGGMGRSIASNIAFLEHELGDPERAKKIDENLANMPYEPGVAGIGEAIFQFLTPLPVAGQAAQLTKLGTLAKTAITSGIVGATSFSGQQARLSDLVQEHPRLANPVTEYLATDPDDTFAEGRFKNALEFMGIDVAVVGPFMLALKGLRGVKAAGKGGQSGGEIADQLNKQVKKANPNQVVRPPVNGRVEVAHSGAMQLPDKVVEQAGRTLSKVFDGVNAVREAPVLKIGLGEKAIRPLSSRVEELSPYFAKNLTRFEVEQNVFRNDFLQRVNPFLENYGNMTSADKKLFSRHAFNSDIIPARKVLNKYSGKKGMDKILDNFEDMRTVFDDLQKMANDNGLKVEYTKHYFPRMLDDYDGFLKAIGKDPDKKLDDAFAKALDDALGEKQKTLAQQAAALGRPLKQATSLTKFEEQEVARKFLDSQYRGQGKQGYQFNRKIKKIDEKYMRYYGGFGSNVQRYINNLTYRVAKNRFTGDSPLAPNGGYKKEVTERMADGRLRPGEAQEIERLFDVRLRGGEQSVGDGYRTLANITYLSTIGNPISTITQTSEAFLNAFRNGVFHTAKTAGKTMKGTGIRLKDLDLEVIAKEMVDPIATTTGRGFTSKLQKGTRKFLDFALDKSFFRKVDFMMKESNLNGAMSKAQQQLKNPKSAEYKDFVAKQSKFFEGETQNLVDAIKKGDINDPNVKNFLYAKLARTQPISLSEYPEYYIKNKNARPFYFLKSFGLKQLETTRREVLRKISSSNAQEVREGMKQGIRLSVLFGGGITGVNTVKDWLLDRDDRPGMFEGNQMPTRERLASNAMDGILTLFGLSKYNTYRIKDDTGKGVIEVFMPPRSFEVLDGIGGLLKGDPSKLGRTLEKSFPLVGKIWSEHWGSAAAYKRKKRIEKFKQNKRALEQSLEVPSLEIEGIDLD